MPKEITIAIGYKADGTPVHLYTGFNSILALEKLDQAGASRQIISGDVYHAPTPYRSRAYTKSGVGSDGGATALDEQARMQRINELKLLSHEEVVQLAAKHGITADNKPIDDKHVKKSMANRMYTIVRIYDAEAKAKAEAAAAEAKEPEEVEPEDTKKYFS